MTKVQDALEQLVIAACQYPHGSPERQKRLTNIIKQVTPKLWHEPTSYYEDALQQTWIYFCRNLCASTTGKQYDPDQASVATWLNAYLKRRLQDGFIAEQAKKTSTVSTSFCSDAIESNRQTVLDSLASPSAIPPMLEQVRQWIETDPQGELRNIHIDGYTHVTCQVLLLRRLPPETPWKQLAIEFDISVGSLSSFYARQCMPRLRLFGEAEGYL